MRSRTLLFFCASIIGTILATTNLSCTPSQIHLSFGDSYYSVEKLDDLRLPSEIINDNQAYLVWNTKSVCHFSVQVVENDTQSVISTQPVDFYQHFIYNYTKHNDTANNGTYNTVTYTALLKNITYDTFYQYSILNENNTQVAGPFKFRMANPNFMNITRKVVLVGNLDNQLQGNITIEELASEMSVEYDNYAGIIQLGDIAYNLQDNNGTGGDSFFNAIQPFAAVSPLIMTPGSLESYANFSFFDLRVRNPLFNMTKNHHFFSFNLQGIHFVNIDLDFYDMSTSDVQQQMEAWIQNDLTTSNDEAHRALWPFIVVVSSKAIYCLGNSNLTEGVTCNNSYAKRQNWDELFHTNKVDLMVSAQSNAYERLGSIYKNQSVDYTQPEDGNINDIINPTATVYITEGGAGSSNVVPQEYQPYGFGKFVDTEPGYGALYIQNTTADLRLIYEHYDSDTGSKVDYVNIIKPKTIVNPDTGSNSGSPDSHILFKLLVPALLVGIVLIGAVCWRRRNKEPEMVRLNDEFKSNKIYGKRSTETTISMVDLVL